MPKFLPDHWSSMHVFHVSVRVLCVRDSSSPCHAKRYISNMTLMIRFVALLWALPTLLQTISIVGSARELSFNQELQIKWVSIEVQDSRWRWESYKESKLNTFVFLRMITWTLPIVFNTKPKILTSSNLISLPNLNITHVLLVSIVQYKCRQRPL